MSEHPAVLAERVKASPSSYTELEYTLARNYLNALDMLNLETSFLVASLEEHNKKYGRQDE